VRRIGGERVGFYAQPVNVGHTRNFNTCVRRSRGELVHLLHGDDLVYDGFYERMGALADAAPDAGALICRHAAVLEDGTPFGNGTLLREAAGPVEGWLAWIASGQLLQPPAVVIRRSLYERIGGYDERLARYGEDWEMWVRIAAATTVWYEPAVLAAYRTRPDSLSSTTHLAANMRDMRLVLATNRDTMRGHLPPAEARRADRTARVELGKALVRRARRALNAGSTASPARSAIEAVHCSRDLRVSVSAGALMVRWLAAVVRPRS
jgi:GT2 family glycosyltransferase